MHRLILNSLNTCNKRQSAKSRGTLVNAQNVVARGKASIIKYECKPYQHKLNLSFFNKKARGFPGGAVVENLPANAGHTGSSPGLGRSHMPRSNWARAPQLLSLRIWSLCSATKSSPPLTATRESLRAATKTQRSQK